MRIHIYTLFFLCMAFQLNAQLVINEISYNSPESNTDSLEYIELYNAGTEHYDLTGYYFLGISDTLPTVHLLPGQFFVTAVSASAMMNVFGVNVHEWQAED